MTNAGKRSKCCFTCRARRVKCDLQVPHCRRCVQDGRSCPGYPEAWDTMLRIQNNYARNKVQARVNKVRKERIERARQAPATIPRGVHITAELHSWNRFYRDYVVHSGIPVFSALPRFYTSSSSVCFQETLQAVTLASSARQLRQSGLMVRARWHYGKSIASLNVTLCNPVLAADDSVLMTLFLLSVYEMIVPEYFETIFLAGDSQCHIHFGGVLVLLQWRAEQAQVSELDACVLGFFSYISLLSTFVNHGPSDRKWSTFEGYMAPWAKGPLLEPILGRAVHFKRMIRARVTTTACHPSGMDVLQLIREGISIGDGLEAAAASVKASSDPNLPSSQQPTAFNNTFEVSTKTTEVIARSLYQSTRYYILELVVSLFPFLRNEGDGTSHESLFQNISHKMPIILEEVCGEMSSLLMPNDKHNIEGDDTGIAYRGFGIFWSMIILLFSPSAEQKKAWVHRQLKLIGETTGLGLATWTAGQMK